MRWGDVDITYARPLRWIVSLFGEEVVPFQVGPIQAGRTTYGHRQLAPEAIRIKISTRLSSKPHQHLSWPIQKKENKAFRNN